MVFKKNVPKVNAHEKLTMKKKTRETKDNSSFVKCSFRVTDT